MELLTTTSLAMFQTTKQDRLAFCNQVIEAIESGETDALKIHLQVKSAEDLIKQLTANETYKKYLLDEASKYGKSFEFMNAKIETKEVGVKYDYSQTNDSVLFEMETRQIELSEKLKQRQKFLQTVHPAGLIVTDIDSGETFKVFPPSKTSTTSIAVTLK